MSEDKNTYVSDTSASFNKTLCDQFKIIKTHPERGCHLMSHASLENTVLDGINFHHERLDGSGYPYGITGDSIPLIARIIAVAEYYDEWVYGYNLDKSKCIANIMTMAGTYFDTEVVNAFLMIVDTSQDVFQKIETSDSKWIQ